MKRIRMAAIWVALAGAFSLSAAGASAQTAPQGMRTAQAAQPMVTEASAQRRVRRPPTRLRVYPNYQWEPDVYPRYNPGPNAVRECNATYVQEYRPSGTVIVPRMSCYWRRG
jgi:lipoprotein-anchoring transpeptidase ErfK/SrfK